MDAEKIIEFFIMSGIHDVNQFMEHDVFFTGLLGLEEEVVQRYDYPPSVTTSPECFHLSDLYQVGHVN